MNSFKTIGTKMITAMIATGLVAGAAFAATPTVTVNLPQSVNVGGATLASGEYTVSQVSMTGGISLFVFRSDKGESTSAVALKNAEPAVDQKTAVVLENQDGSLHLDKIFIAGEATGYQFAESK